MILTVLLTLLSLNPKTDSTYNTELEVRGIYSKNGIVPFWQRSLNYGEIPDTSPSIVSIIRSYKKYDLNKVVDWNYQFQLTNWNGDIQKTTLTEARIGAKWKKWEIWGGRKKEIFGIGDTLLSSGFYSWSGNAIPIPKIQIGTIDYLDFFKKWAGVHMTYSHGWFDSQGLIEGQYLHQKTLYGRLGKPNSKINLLGGLNHQVQWGGRRRVPSPLGIDVFPSDLSTYFYVITLLKDRTIVKISDLTSEDDANNQYGNHLGSIDFAVKYNSGIGAVMAYKQTPYESGRIFSLVTADDGLYGISFKSHNRNSLLSNLVLEYLYTANQGQYISGIGKLFNVIDPHYQFLEGYFNNGGQASTWSYMNKEFGTPLIVLDKYTKQGGGLYYSYNSVKSIYMGIGGNFKTIQWKFKFSNSNHGYPGLPSYQFINQISTYASIQKLINKKIIVNMSFAQDKGERFENSNSYMILINYKLF